MCTRVTGEAPDTRTPRDTPRRKTRGTDLGGKPQRAAMGGGCPVPRRRASQGAGSDQGAPGRPLPGHVRSRRSARDVPPPRPRPRTAVSARLAPRRSRPRDRSDVTGQPPSPPQTDAGVKRGLKTHRLSPRVPRLWRAEQSCVRWGCFQVAKPGRKQSQGPGDLGGGGRGWQRPWRAGGGRVLDPGGGRPDPGTPAPLPLPARARATGHNLEPVCSRRGGAARRGELRFRGAFPSQVPRAADPLSLRDRGARAHAGERACPEACSNQGGRGRGEGRGTVCPGKQRRGLIRGLAAALCTRPAGLAKSHKCLSVPGRVAQAVGGREAKRARPGTRRRPDGGWSGLGGPGGAGPAGAGAGKIGTGVRPRLC